MILTLYLTFVVLAMLILGVGVFLGENYFSFIGLFFLFLLGFNLLFNGVDYHSGEERVSVFVYDNSSLVNQTETVSFQYTNFKNDDFTRWFGLFIALTAGFGMAAILTQARRDFQDRYEKVREFGE